MITICQSSVQMTLLVLCFALSGCSKNTRTASDLAIQPGLGIRNVCELGWNERQLRIAGNQLQIYRIEGDGWSSERSIVITDLGIVGHVPSGKLEDPVELYTFHMIKGNVHGILYDAFRGRIGNGLSVDACPMSSEALQAQFGTITNNAENARAILPFAQVAEPYRWVTPWGIEQLAYPNLGITFNVRSNVVESVEVYSAGRP